MPQVRSVAATAPAEASHARVEASLATVLEQRGALVAALAVSPEHDQGAWQQHGSLLAGVDRLRVELASAVHPGVGAWRPAPLTERPREVVRRVVATPRRRHR